MAFVKIKTPNEVYPILEERLPKSANMYNMAVMWSRFPEMEFFTLFGDMSSNAWIIAIYKREDYGSEINISAPPIEEPTKKIEDAFVHSAPFDWSQPFSFCVIERRLSQFFLNICINIKGLNTLVLPSYLNFMKREDALAINMPKFDACCEMKSLQDGGNEGIEFVWKNWKYSAEGSKEYIEKLVFRNESGGVFKNGIPVSGVIFNASGLIGYLHTKEEERRNGFGEGSMKFIMRQLASNGLYPVCTVEMSNAGGIDFQKKLGFNTLHNVDYIAHYNVQK